jgi:small membrane protein
MTAIQFILITGVITLLVYYLMLMRSAIAELVLLIVLSAISVFFILFPNKTNVIAHKLGVGRGADLLFYVCILLFLFFVLKLFSRIRRLEKKLTEIIRKDAIDEEASFRQPPIRESGNESDNTKDKNFTQ